MFKKMSFVLLVSFCFVLLGNKVFAESEEGKKGEILFKGEEITDNEELTSMFFNDEHKNIELGEFADFVLQQKQSVTLTPDSELGVSAKNIKGEIEETGETMEISPVVQLLEIRNDENGLREEIYSLSYLVDIEDNGDGGYTLSNKSRGDYRYDPSLSVRASSTIYVATKNDSSGVQHARLLRANGNWKVEQTGIILSSREVVYGTIGPSRFGSTTGQKRTIKPSGNTWSVTAPTWTHSYGHVGSTSVVNISGRTSHKLYLCNVWFGGGCL